MVRLKADTTYWDNDPHRHLHSAAYVRQLRSDVLLAGAQNGLELRVILHQGAESNRQYRRIPSRQRRNH
jgi:hypothetical protein